MLRHIVRAALEPEYVVHRADDDSNPGAITPQIIGNILEADLIVADISGGNANVFYELAIAHGYDRPTVHIQNAGQRVPFDIKDMRTITYDIQDLDSVEDAKKALAESAKFAAADPSKIDTPLRGAESFKAVKESGDPTAHVQAQILADLAELKAVVMQRKHADAGSSDSDYSADVKSQRTILNRAGRAGRLDSADFGAVITTVTTPDFDEWARTALGNLLKTGDERALNALLFNADIMRRYPHDYEPPF